MPDGGLLGAWNGFYVLIGSAAAALTGLTFVVITLVINNQRGATSDGVSIFSTPTVVHFSCALLIAAVMAMPFRSLAPLAIVLAAIAAAGLVHSVRIAVRTSRLETYKPDAEDWLWHVALPLVAYATILAGAAALHWDAGRALFAPAIAVVLLIAIGIHNAWDVVTFIATNLVTASSEDDAGSRTDTDPPAPETSAPVPVPAGSAKPETAAG
jgi:hypothetical protein